LDKYKKSPALNRDFKKYFYQEFLNKVYSADKTKPSCLKQEGSLITVTKRFCEQVELTLNALLILMALPVFYTHE